MLFSGTLRFQMRNCRLFQQDIGGYTRYRHRLREGDAPAEPLDRKFSRISGSFDLPRTAICDRWKVDTGELTAWFSSF